RRLPARRPRNRRRPRRRRTAQVLAAEAAMRFFHSAACGVFDLAVLLAATQTPSPAPPGTSPRGRSSLDGYGLQPVHSSQEEDGTLAPEACSSQLPRPLQALKMLRTLFLLVAMLNIISPFPLAQSSPQHSPSTLRIGLWTLWHDKTVTVTRTPGGSATLRTCESCAAAP